MTAVNTLRLSGGIPEDIARAGEILRAGGLVGIPTETVYGLAADALNPAAVGKIFAAKGRPADNPLIVHICDIGQWAPLVESLPERALRLAKAFWPGPLTIILKKRPIVPDIVTGGLDTVAVRFPSHPVAAAVLRAAGVPLAAPSANRSGKPSPTSFAALCRDMEGRAEALLDGGDCAVGVESTVISLTGEKPRLLRPGGVTLAQLEEVLGAVEVDPAVLDRLQEGEKAASPGMKYKHYAPRAEVTLVDASPQGYVDFVNAQAGAFALCFEEDREGLALPFLSYGGRFDSAAQARNLFSCLSALDERGAQQVFAHQPKKSGVGLAVFNRLIRAAAFRVLRPEQRPIIGLTGPSGSGKSTLGQLLAQKGFHVIDCDAVSREEGVYDAQCIRELQEAFGEDIAPGGVLDRRLTAQRALASPDGKKRLQAVTFPRILRRVEGEIARAFGESDCRAVVLDAPTLFEAGLDRRCLRVWSITAPEEERLARVMRRDNISREMALARFSAQMPEEVYRQRSDFVFDNAAGADLESQLERLLALEDSL